MFHSSLALTLALAIFIWPHAVLGLSVHRSPRVGLQQPLISEPVPPPFNCDLPTAVDPAEDGFPAARDIFIGDAVMQKQVQRLSTLVKIPSVSSDSSGQPGRDPAWDVFYRMQDALASLYPTV